MNYCCDTDCRSVIQGVARNSLLNCLKLEKNLRCFEGGHKSFKVTFVCFFQKPELYILWLMSRRIQRSINNVGLFQQPEIVPHL